MDDEEWRAGLAVVQRSSPADISSLLVVLLRTNDESSRAQPGAALTMARIREVLALVEKGQVGLPVACDFDTAFFEVLDAFNYLYAADNRIIS